jgi:hypothetical protein
VIGFPNGLIGNLILSAIDDERLKLRMGGRKLVEMMGARMVFDVLEMAVEEVVAR